MEDTAYQKIMENRLNNIEKTLNELKDVVIENKMQNRDIRDLNDKVSSFLDAVNAHEKRIRDLELAPTKAKAERWQQVIDLVYKVAISAAVLGVFAKIGLQ